MTYHSKNAYALIGKETTYGTAVTADKDIGIIQNIAVTDKNNLMKIFSLSARNAQQLIATKFETGLDIELYLQHGRLLEYLFGSVTHDATNTPDYKHTYTEADDIPSFTLEDGFNSTSDAVLTYPGNKIVNATVSLAVNGILSLKATTIAKTVATTTTASSSVISTLPVLTSYQGDLKVGADGSEASLGEIQSFNLNVNNTAEGIFGLNSRFLSKLQAKNRDYDFDFNMGFENLTEYARFLDGGTGTSPSTSGITAASLVFDVTNGVAVGSGLREFYFKLGTVKYEEVGTPVKVGDFIFQDFKGQALNLASGYSYDNITDTAW